MDFYAHTVLGRTGLHVSRLGIAAGYGAPSFAIEKAFREHGVNTFYWGARRKDGMEDALRNLCRWERERIVVIFQTFDRSGFLMRRRHENGLSALGIEYSDILVLGWANREPAGRWLETALRLKEEGKVKFLGVSGHKRHILGGMAARPELPFDVYMVRYNAAHTGAEQEIFPLLPGENPPGVMIYTATRWGQLLQARRMPPGEEPLTAADCYRFALSNPHVDLCMMGPRSAEELEGGLETLRLGPLSDEEMGRVRWIGGHVHGR
jgi:aryl-alcohol dehydrogenase-like predicted oxidoreductase